MSDPTSPPKVLMLHGYGQNVNIFSKRVAALRKSFGKDIELVFVDAPHVLEPVDLTGHGTHLDAFGAPEASVASEDPTLKPRGWWLTDPTRTRTDGLEESLAHLRDILRTQRFEGVFGFSQGAAMAALLAALLERPHLHPSFLVDGEPPHPRLYVTIRGASFLRPMRCTDVFPLWHMSPQQILRCGGRVQGGWTSLSRNFFGGVCHAHATCSGKERYSRRGGAFTSANQCLHGETGGRARRRPLRPIQGQLADIPQSIHARSNRKHPQSWSLLSFTVQVGHSHAPCSLMRQARGVPGACREMALCLDVTIWIQSS